MRKLKLKGKGYLLKVTEILTTGVRIQNQVGLADFRPQLLNFPRRQEPKFIHPCGIPRPDRYPIKKH